MANALSDRPFSQTQLFCSNLPWSVNGKMLRQHFEVHGEVTDAFVAYNGRSSRGFGYVTFKEAKGAVPASVIDEKEIGCWIGFQMLGENRRRKTRGLVVTGNDNCRLRHEAEFYPWGWNSACRLVLFHAVGFRGGCF